jgi:hypothetical protein
MLKVITPYSIIITSLIFLQSCVSVFSELQGARTVGKNNIEVTPSGSLVYYENKDKEYIGDKNRQKAQNQLGVQVAYGITPKFDLRFRYERIWIAKESQYNFRAVGIAPKYSIWKDHIAASLMIGKGMGEGIGISELWQLHPTMLFTIPLLKDKIDLNLSPKYLTSFELNTPGDLAFNMGLSISNNVSKWSLKPEFGLLMYSTSKDIYSHVSLGLSYKFGKN